MCLFQPIKDCKQHFSTGREYENSEPSLKKSVERAHEHYSYAASILVRVAAAALGAFILINTTAPAIALTLGVMISLPTTMIAVGSLGMYYGYVAVVAALATESFAALGIGLLSLAAGYFCIQNYMFKNCGIVEIRLPQAPTDIV